MKLRLSSKKSAPWTGMTAVKITVLLVALLVLLSPISRGVSRSEMRGPRTVLPALIRPFRTAPVLSEHPARVAAVVVAPGAEVEAGQLIVALESDEIKAEVARARARFNYAQQRLERFEKSSIGDIRQQILNEQYRSAARTWETAQKRLEENTLTLSEMAYTQAQSRSARLRELAARQLATADEMDRGVLEERDELRRLKSAREHASRLAEEAERAESAMRVAKLELSMHDGSELPAARLEFDEAVAALQLANQRFMTLRVTARRPGTVVGVDVNAGDFVTAGMRLLQIADLSQLNFEVPVSAEMARQIPRGSPVAVRIPTDPPREINASVSGLVLQPDQQTQSYMVRVTIPNPDPQAILAGLEGAVSFPHLEKSWKGRLFF